MEVSKKTFNFLVEAVGRAILIVFYLYLANAHMHIFVLDHKLSSLLYVSMESVFLGLVIFRSAAIQFSTSPFDWFIAYVAVLSPLLIAPTGSPDQLFGLLLQCLGIIITTSGMISLNTSFGIIPANRGVKTGGMYKIIRHPLYAGYMIVNVAILLNHYNISNLLCVITGTSFQIIRILREEKFLSQNEEYRQLIHNTQWRIMPLIW